MATDRNTPDAEMVAIDQVTEALIAEHPDLPRERIIDTVRAQHNAFTKGVVRDFVPLFVERRARTALKSS